MPPYSYLAPIPTLATKINGSYQDSAVCRVFLKVAYLSIATNDQHPTYAALRIMAYSTALSQLKHTAFLGMRSPLYRDHNML